MRIILWACAVIGLAVVVSMAVGPDHQKFTAFSAQRDAWHRKCDAYLQTTASDVDAPKAQACKQELDELTAYAKTQGW